MITTQSILPKTARFTLDAFTVPDGIDDNGYCYAFFDQVIDTVPKQAAIVFHTGDRFPSTTFCVRHHDGSYHTYSISTEQMAHGRKLLGWAFSVLEESGLKGHQATTFLASVNQALSLTHENLAFPPRKPDGTRQTATPAELHTADRVETVQEAIARLARAYETGNEAEIDAMRTHYAGNVIQLAEAVKTRSSGSGLGK